MHVRLHRLLPALGLALLAACKSDGIAAPIGPIDTNLG